MVLWLNALFLDTLLFLLSEYCIAILSFISDYFILQYAQNYSTTHTAEEVCEMPVLISMIAFECHIPPSFKLNIYI